jgi:hypothetical protein
MMEERYMILGHSGATEETFPVPYNVTIVFLADENSICYAPHTELPFLLREGENILQQPEDPRIQRSGQQVGNYAVEILSDADGIYHADQKVPIDPGIYSLKDLVFRIQKRSARKPVIVYCVFCRGSLRGVEGMDFGNTQTFDWDPSLENLPRGGKKKKSKKSKNLKRSNNTKNPNKKKKKKTKRI